MSDWALLVKNQNHYSIIDKVDQNRFGRVNEAANYFFSKHNLTEDFFVQNLHGPNLSGLEFPNSPLYKIEVKQIGEPTYTATWDISGDNL